MLKLDAVSCRELGLIREAEFARKTRQPDVVASSGEGGIQVTREIDTFFGDSEAPERGAAGAG